MTEKIEFDRDRAIQYDLDIRKAIPGLVYSGLAIALFQ